tara:strand:- start:3223 stop:3987 length:765 start_codon:yes stop_codon:yes gene_type:complete
MRIVLITQKEPFYLAENISYLLKKLPKESKIVAAVIANPSPFGNKESFYRKAIKTLNIFGLKFFIFYSLKYIFNYFRKNKNVETILKKNGVSIIKLEKSINHKSSIEKIKSYSPDLLVSLQGNEIFKKPIIELAPKGCINLHSALLPEYRGLMPTFWVLKNDEKNTGVSVFFVDEGIDSGPIIVQERVKIINQTHRELIIETKKIGMKLILKAIQKINSNNFTLITNDDAKKTYFSFPKKSDVKEFKIKGKRFF